MAELLLDRGANPNVHVDSSGSSVYSAYSHKQWHMVELLRSRGGIATADTAPLYRQTDLAREILAANPGDEPIVKDLLRFGADGGAVEIVRMALTHIDWPRDHASWFRMLSSPLAFWHHIPWLYAGNKDLDREGYLACFRLILEACDVNVTGGFGRTILHEIAAMADWITDDEVEAFARAALDAGARMDRRDAILKSTPLGWACRWGRAPLVKLLIDHGADPEETDSEPWARPRAWALKMGHDRILPLLP
jgi:ankyrin repeat protein